MCLAVPDRLENEITTLDVSCLQLFVGWPHHMRWKKTCFRIKQLYTLWKKLWDALKQWSLLQLWKAYVIQLKPATSQRKRMKKTSQVTRLSATIWIFTSMWNTCPMHWIGLNVSWKSFAISVMMRHAISVWFCDFLRFSALFHRTRLRFSHKKFFISWKPILPYFTLTVPFDLW